MLGSDHGAEFGCDVLVVIAGGVDGEGVGGGAGSFVDWRAWLVVVEKAAGCAVGFFG